MKNSSHLMTLSDISPGCLKNQRILVRADFNIPISDDGVINDGEDWRIKAALPTIEYLLKQRARIILLAHLGRPGGKVAEKLRLTPVQNKLSFLLGVSVEKMPDCVGKNVKKAVSEMASGQILMLENLRFHKGEEYNDKKFAEELASLGDFYVNDAFSDSHRKHASIAGIAKFLPSCAGFLMEKEVKTMERAKNPKHPAIAIIGGAKLETKLPAVAALAEIYDYVLAGGMIGNELLFNPGQREIKANIILPKIANKEDKKYFDIGNGAIREFSKLISGAKSIVWNGPMGKFEDPDFAAGTKGIISAIKSAYENGANILIGGGETIYAVQKFAPEFFNTPEKIHISIGGGAMLEFLAGKKLPGIEALKADNRIN